VVFSPRLHFIASRSNSFLSHQGVGAGGAVSRLRMKNSFIWKKLLPFSAVCVDLCDFVQDEISYWCINIAANPNIDQYNQYMLMS
jgi:hypothetical protein